MIQKPPQRRGTEGEGNHDSNHKQAGNRHDQEAKFPVTTQVTTHDAAPFGSLISGHPRNAPIDAVGRS